MPHLTNAHKYVCVCVCRDSDLPHDDINRCCVLLGDGADDEFNARAL